MYFTLIYYLSSGITYTKAMKYVCRFRVHKYHLLVFLYNVCIVYIHILLCCCTCENSRDITMLYIMPSGASGWTVEEVHHKMKYTSNIIILFGYYYEMFL